LTTYHMLIINDACYGTRDVTLTHSRYVTVRLDKLLRLYSSTVRRGKVTIGRGNSGRQRRDVTDLPLEQWSSTMTLDRLTIGSVVVNDDS